MVEDSRSHFFGGLMRSGGRKPCSESIASKRASFSRRSRGDIWGKEIQPPAFDPAGNEIVLSRENAFGKKKTRWHG